MRSTAPTLPLRSPPHFSGWGPGTMSRPSRWSTATISLTTCSVPPRPLSWESRSDAHAATITSSSRSRRLTIIACLRCSSRFSVLGTIATSTIEPSGPRPSWPPIMRVWPRPTPSSIGSGNGSKALIRPEIDQLFAPVDKPKDGKPGKKRDFLVPTSGQGVPYPAGEAVARPVGTCEAVCRQARGRGRRDRPH